MVLFFLVLFFIIIFTIFIFLNSSFKLSVNKLIIDTEKKKYDYEFKFGLYFINKIRIIGFKINKERIEKIKKEIKQLENSKTSKLLSKIDIDKISSKLEKKLKEQIRKNDINILKIIKIILKNLKLQTLKYKMNLQLGIEDVALNSILIAVISSFISIILRLTVKDIKNYNNYFYEILPIYGKRNIIKLNLNCIINLKLVHIINIIYLVNKEGRSDKYVRTSNRRSYDYCHE